MFSANMLLILVLGRASLTAFLIIGFVAVVISTVIDRKVLRPKLRARADAGTRTTRTAN